MKSKNYFFFTALVVIVIAVSAYLLIGRNTSERGVKNPFISQSDSALLDESGVVLNQIKGIAVIENGTFRTDLLQFATNTVPASIPVAFINNHQDPIEIKVLSKPTGVGDIPVMTLRSKQSNKVVFDEPGKYTFVLTGNNDKSLTVEVIKLIRN